MTDPNNNTHVDTFEFDPADGQQYISELHDRLITILQDAHRIEDVEERLRKLYPESKLVDLAISEANKHKNESHKTHKTRHHSSSSSGASFTDTLHNIKSLAKATVNNLGRVGNKSDNEVSRYKEALIQFILDDVLNLARNFVRRQKGDFIITRSDIRTAMHADKDLLDMFLSDDKSLIITENPILANCAEKANHSNGVKGMSYKEKVRIMVDSENTFIRGLKLIIKVFKADMESWSVLNRQDVQTIFCNIDELMNLSNVFLNVLEEALESVGQEEEIPPFVGSQILDLASAEEFHAYFTFADRRLSPSWHLAYSSITSRTTNPNDPFDSAVRHLLPNYLLNIIVQFFQYFRNITDLYEIGKQKNYKADESALKETISILLKTKKAIEVKLEKSMVNEPASLEPKLAERSDAIRSFLERKLDAKLQIERNLPLPYMPPLDQYRFSEPDTRDNIRFEAIKGDQDDNVIPVIKCATLTKLVERLTYHKYQPNIVDSFLTTYRSFISNPEELLDLLIQRFNIPDPPINVVVGFEGDIADLRDCERTAYKLYIKRFTQEYSKPVKMRVINVLKSWVKNHYQDFERNPNLLQKLNTFLDEVCSNEKLYKGLIEPIKKSIEQQKICQPNRELMVSGNSPETLWWLTDQFEKFDILNLHPVEFARQLTLREFDLYRAIKPSELINKQESKSSENLSNLERHFNLISYWVQKCIVESEDERKREAIYTRSIEIMAVLRDLNNYIGLLSIGSAIVSAAVNRLSLKRWEREKNIRKCLDDYEDLVGQHLKKLQLELKACNPPCIPYLGYYQTKLIQAKEGNKTFIDEVDTSTISPTLSHDESFSNSPATPITPRLPPSATPSMNHNQFFGTNDVRSKTPKMINFYKQRIQAEMIAEITNYQNQPYCLKPQREIQEFIKKIEMDMRKFAINKLKAPPLDWQNMANKFDEYLFEQSKRIEPDPERALKSKPKMPAEYKSPPGILNSNGKLSEKYSYQSIRQVVA